jgi:gamma-glutamyltranspeptidase/glutathione hydrolase
LHEKILVTAKEFSALSANSAVHGFDGFSDMNAQRAYTKTFILVATLSLVSATLVASWRKPVKAKHGMVVCAESLAARAGIEMLKRGGNAIDAAVAVGFTLAVTFPEAGNIGGGGFMLIRFADGKSTMIDFREKAPARATRTMYLDSAGGVIPNRSEYGPLAAGVPGSVAGLLFALEKYGTMRRSQVIAPAIEIAHNGFPLSQRMVESFNEHAGDFSGFASTMKTFTKKENAFVEGEMFRQRDLARTLRAISAHGRDGFYKGDVAEKIVAEMRRSGGIITKADLENYNVVERSPLFGTYRGYDIITASPPSAGGVVLLQILNMLEPYDMQRKGHNSSQAIHLFAAAAQRAYADRAEYLGDPDFVNVPTQWLTSKNYAWVRGGGIDSTKAVASALIRAGVPAEIEESGKRHETTHFCVADKFGNVVAVTTTLNGLYGGKVVVEGAGFFLNNEMDDFVIKPGVPNMYGLLGGDANAIVSNKRMLSSMTPTIVVKDGKPFLTVGGRGGSRISTAVATVILNVIDFKMNIQDAVEAPRIHYQWLPDKIFYESHSISHDVIQNLHKIGYTLEHTSHHNARVQGMMFDHARGLILGGPDPREEGVALGY